MKGHQCFLFKVFSKHSHIIALSLSILVGQIGRPRKVSIPLEVQSGLGNGLFQ